MITKDNNVKVMEFFFKNPQTPTHIRELARKTGLSSAGIIKIVNKLKKEKLLKSSKRANLEEITPDFEGKFYFMKRLYNLFSLYDSNLINYLKEFYEMPSAIILFGSYADGNDSERSDVDIAIITGKDSVPDTRIFEKKLERKINIQTLKIEKMSKEFKNSLANGIVLEGFIELIK